jgi:uncharacterized protein YcfL
MRKVFFMFTLAALSLTSCGAKKKIAELEKQNKGIVIRQAINPEKHKVLTKKEGDLSPSEKIAQKKKLFACWLILCNSFGNKNSRCFFSSCNIG